jgi:hypothetical protein
MDHDKIYGLIVEPGDAQMIGGIASSGVGGLGWATSDNWATNYRMGYRTAIQVYGTPVPEPSPALALGALAIPMWSLVRRRLIRRRPHHRASEC